MLRAILGESIAYSPIVSIALLALLAREEWESLGEETATSPF